MIDDLPPELEALSRRAGRQLRDALGNEAAPRILLERIRTEPGRADGGGPRWWRQPAFLLAAALLIGIGLGAAGSRLLDGREPRAAAETAAAGAELRRDVRFVLVAPGARHVSLVGEFNGWSTTATPMTPAGDGTEWAVTVPLAPGRHLYAFIVNDSSWTPDPQAPLAPESWFGVRNSVVVVGDRVGM